MRKTLRALIGAAVVLAALGWWNDVALARHRPHRRHRPILRSAMLYRPVSYRGVDREGRPMQAQAPQPTPPQRVAASGRDMIRPLTPQDDADRRSKTGIRYLGEFITPPKDAERFGRSGRELSAKDLIDLSYMGWPQTYQDMRGRFGFPTYQTALEDYYQLPNARWLRISYSRQGKATGADIGS